MLKIDFNQEELEKITEAVAVKVAAKLRPLMHTEAQGKDFTVVSLAKHLDIPTRKIYEMTSRKEIPFYKVGNKLRFRPDDIVKWKFATYIPAVNGPFSEMEGGA